MSESTDRIRQQIDLSRLPQHVAIIMDGNGRWAKSRQLPRLWGHRVGATSVREIVRAAGEIGIKALTLYAFSTENWSRPTSEISGLMRLLKVTLRREQKNLDENNVRLATIGDISRLPDDVQEQLHKTITCLNDNTGLLLVLALNYGSRQDLVQACNSLLEEGVEQMSEDLITQRLSTHKLPPLDLLIRTSGEYRISNFLLWELAYAEIHVTPVFWPDFRKKDFYKALLDYQARERRFGALR